MPEMSPVAEFDFIIVGAGSAGCLLANRLSANPDHRVLLVEAGGKDNWFWIKVPVGYLYTIANPRTDWCFTTEADPGLAGRSIHYARGRVIGGSSSINAMIHVRGQASDYDLWAQATGDERWLWGGPDGTGETLAIYKKLEDYFGGADDWHGVGGEIPVERPRVRWKILDAWQAAAAQVGIAPIDEFNRGDNAGSAYFHVNQRRGRRWSMADAFLHPVAHRPNLTVYTHTQALRLLMDDQVHEGSASRCLDHSSAPRHRCAAAQRWPNHRRPSPQRGDPECRCDWVTASHAGFGSGPGRAAYPASSSGGRRSSGSG